MNSTLTIARQEELLRLARAANLKPRSSDPAAIEPVDRDAPLPLSFAQQRLWFVEQVGDTGGAYNIRKSVRLKGSLDRAALDRALAHLTARHEALRTTFVQVDDEPEQRIAAVDESTFRLEDVDLIGASNVDAALNRVMAADAADRFDLARGPLIRGRLIRLAEDDHALVLSMHHIVSDGWSMGILANEVSALYDAFRRGAPNPLPPLEIQYADFAAWQRRWITREALQGQAAYWAKTLAGAPELLSLPTDFKRPPVQDFTGDAVRVELDEALTAGLKTLTRRHGTTLFMTLLAGLAAVLSRLAGQSDVVIGTPVANRGRREIEGLIGFFTNTLALRVDLSGAPTVAELLGRVRARTLEGQENQDIPFEQVVELIHPVRSLAHGPLFQVTFAWHNSPTALALPGLEVRELGSASHITAKSDLLLTLAERRGRIAGMVTFPTALFRAETVARYVEYFRRVLEGMVADEHQQVDRLLMMTDAEHLRVVKEWNATQADYPREQCVHELFEAQAAQCPDAVAVADGVEAITYAALNRRANQLAHALRACGVRPDQRVAICAGPSIELLVGLLGVLKAGGAYVPLDPTYPPERLRDTLADSAPVAVLAQETSREWLEAMPVPVLALAGHAVAEWQSQPDVNPARAGLTPAHLAYVIYTSGSTGRAKGVMVEHRGLTHYACWARAQYLDGAAPRVALYSSVAFDLTVTSIYVPLIAGGTIEVYPDVPGGEPAIVRVFAADAVDVVKLTPSHLRLVDRPELRPRRIRRLILGGEDLKVELAQSIHAASSGCEIDNEYGPTETVVGCMIHRFTAERDIDGSVPIGRPIANTQIYVLDDAGAPVPVGVVGELCIGGVGVARGYVGRPGLTAERFVADGLSGTRGGRLYRTGDLARWRADGTVEFLGRNDHQVKVRGHRIELGEIEARLAEHSAVRSAVVVVRREGADDDRLVAYWVGEAVGAETLRTYLADRLPEAMVPSAYVRLETLPLTPNGKIDRHALPAPEADAYNRRRYEPPVGATEVALAEIWSELLHVPEVGRHDDFFELGGHSLLALKVIQLMRRRGLHATIESLFTNPTLSLLAAATRGESQDPVAETPSNGIPSGCTAITPQMLPLVELDQAEIDGIVARVAGGAANVQDIYPLAPLQEGILFHHLTAKEGDPYLLMFLLEFDTRARLDTYLTALQAVIDRHDILRTSVMWEGLREPVQVVWRNARLAVEEVQLDPSDGDLAKQLRQRFDARRYRIDIRCAPLFRIYVAHDPVTDRWVMLRQQHHLIADHAAADVLQQEVQAHLAGGASELPQPLPFRDYVARTRSRANEAEQEAFFRSLLGDVTAPTAPFGLLDVLGSGVGIDEAPLEVDRQLAARLRARARAIGVSAASIFHVAWAQVLARVSSQRDVVFGTVLFGRMQGGEEADRILGLFINTLPVRIRVDGTGAEASVRQMHGLLAELIRHEEASLALAQRCSAVPPPAPLFTSLLNYRYSAKAQSNAPRKRTQGIRMLGGEERSNYPLTLAVDDLGERFRLKAKVVSSGAASRVCALMHQALDGLVEALESAPGLPLDSLEVLPEAERVQVVHTWNATAAPYPAEACVHELFEAQVMACPDAVAVVQDGHALSYREVNARANRLAHHLREQGVGPDTRVGICIERSPEMIVGLLAVLKAGGAYVPLDPTYPLQRLRYMLEDSAAVALLTQRSLTDLWTGVNVPVLLLDTAAPEWANRPAANVEHLGRSADQLLYVIYTSGSTGRPKGVLNPHRGVVNRLTWMQKTHRLRADEAVLQNSSFSFDASVFEIFWPLTVGARVVLTRRESYKDPAALLETIRRENVTTAYFVCSMLHYFLEIDGAEKCTSLERLMCGGEALSPSLVRRVGERLPRVALWNLYGPSESAVSVTTRVFADNGDAATVPIGRPVPNVRVYLVGDDGEPVPVGVVGELYVAGAQLARGYAGRPVLTAERFVADWLSGNAGSRLYATGDLGRWRSDGTIEFLGRNDGQLKVRGFRIEPQEIETRLREIGGVRDAVVVAREDTPGDQRLVAYWLGDGEYDPARLRARLADVLPEYMVPSAYVRLETLPRTPSGKIDRRALPAPEGEVYTKRGYEAPVGETEVVLADIWSELLGVARVGRHDHFFELGGHSLLAIRMMERMRRRGLYADVRTLFVTPTLAALAEQTSREAPRTEVPLDAVTRLVPQTQTIDPANTEWRL
jgi:amino acid adenylation domain-containing protein